MFAIEPPQSPGDSYREIFVCFPVYNYIGDLDEQAKLSLCVTCHSPFTTCYLPFSHTLTPTDH